jgi:hypothetical protein
MKTSRYGLIKIIAATTATGKNHFFFVRPGFSPNNYIDKPIRLSEPVAKVLFLNASMKISVSHNIMA